MSGTRSSFEDIPGTIHFDGERLRQGYHFNAFCMTLLKPENRQAFKADEAAYLARFPMSEAQRRAVLNRDWTRMLELGGNIFYIAKLSMCDGISFQHVQASMSGMSDEDYQEMMLAGGRPMNGIRSKGEDKIG